MRRIAQTLCLAALIGLSARPGTAEDCNQNGVEDEVEISERGGAVDCNGNGRLDECELIGDVTVHGHYSTRARSSFDVAAADLTGDGHLDLIGTRSDVLYLMENLGDGTFGDPQDLLPITGSELDAADFDGDGRVELGYRCTLGLCIGWEGTVASLRGTAALMFASTIWRTRDLDGDGHLDVFTPREVFLGLGGRVFSEPFEFSPEIRAADIAAADLDGDGRCEIVIVGSLPDDATVPHAVILRDAGDLSFEQRSEFDPGGRSDELRIVAADLDRNGRDEILIHSGDALTTYGFDPSLGLQEGASYPIGESVFRDLRAVDLDGNGALDIVGLGSEDRVAVLFNRGNGELSLRWSPTIIGSLARLAIANLDGDLGSEIAVSSFNPHIVNLVTVLEAEFGTDLDGTGLPDDCERSFLRGDSNDDRDLDISDGIFLLRYLFLGRHRPRCLDAVDMNDDGLIDVADAIFVNRYLFLAGDEIPVPGPFECGVDPTIDTLGCHGSAACAE